MVRSPSDARSVTARRLRPMSRWISMVRPPWRPCVASRGVRVVVLAGNRLYSAVSQPRRAPRSQFGTPGTSLAVQSTWVSPMRMIVEPSAFFTTPHSMLTGRSWSTFLSVLTLVSCSATSAVVRS
jgi:hypothetical protein